MPASVSQRLFTQGGVYSLAQIANQAMTFLLLPMYGRYLGEEGFGIISLMGVAGTFLGFILIQGLHGAWFRLRFDEDGPAELRRFEATIIWYLLTSVAVGLGVLLLIGRWIAPYCTPNVPFYPLGLLTSIYAAATVFVTLYERKLQAEQRPVAFAIFSGLRTLLMLGTIVLFVAGFGWGAEGKIRADALTAILLGTAALALLKPAGPGAFSPSKLRRSLSYGLPLVPHHIAGLANDLIDRVIISAKLNLAQTGSYTMGYRMGAVGLIVATAVNRAFAPLFITTLKEVENARENGDEESERANLEALARAALQSVTLTACVSLGMAAITREALLIMAPTFTESFRVVAVVGVAIVAWACYFPFSQSITYRANRVVLLGAITVLGAVVNILGNLWLIPRHGVMGAAWATLASSVTLAMAAWWIGQSLTPIPYRAARWAGMLAVFVAGMAGTWWLDTRIDSLGLRIVLKLAVAGSAALACLWMTGVRWADVHSLRRPGGKRS
jgi:O-antigen/teichoic acid export membrane protein